MHTLALLAAMFGADPAVCEAKPVPVMAECHEWADADVLAFLAGQDSLIGRVLHRLDNEGRMQEVLDHAVRSRAQWRRGKPTPRAPGR